MASISLAVCCAEYRYIARPYSAANRIGTKLIIPMDMGCVVMLGNRLIYVMVLGIGLFYI